MVSGTPKIQVQVAGFCPPTKWKSDRLVQACTACARPFNLFRRRHHCRCCGNIFCDICTQQRLDNVQGSVGYMERVCDACHKRTHVAEKKEVQPEKRSVESSHSLADSFMMTLSHKVDRHPKTKSTVPSETDRLEASEVGSSFPSNLKRERRIVLLGSSGVGKTRIAMQYVTKSFATMYVPTIAQTWKKTVYTQQGINYEMVLLDTAGQSAYDSYQSSLSIGTNVYILIYSIFDRSTFTDAEAIYRKVLQCHPVGATFLLVGNKKDLEHSQGLVRTVSSEEGVALARSIGAKTRYLEISATIPSDVERVFDELFETLIVQGESEEKELGMVLIREKRVPDEELILNFGFKMHDSHPEMEFS